MPGAGDVLCLMALFIKSGSGLFSKETLMEMDDDVLSMIIKEVVAPHV